MADIGNRHKKNDNSSDNSGVIHSAKRIEMLQMQLQRLNLYCGNLEAEKYTLQDEVSTLQYKMGLLQSQLELSSENQRKLMETQNQNNRLAENKMQLRDVNQLLPKFNPHATDGLLAEDWVKTVEDLMDVYIIDDCTIMAAIRTRWTGSALSWYETKCRENITWPELKEALKKDFGVKRSV